MKMKIKLTSRRKETKHHKIQVIAMIELFYFQLPEDDYTPREIKEILRNAFAMGKKSGAKAILIETPIDDATEKSTIMLGMLKGNIYRTFAFVGNAHIYIFAPKTFSLPLSHFKHAKTRKQVLLPFIREGATVLTNADPNELRNDVPRMKVLTIGELSI